jgi:diaminopimelate epimerase
MTVRQRINFTKMSGAGNDFILIDNLDGHYRLDWSQIAPKLCDRRVGIGADGLLIIEISTKADFKMNYFNSDGSCGGMCGNGGRCAALFMANLSSNKAQKFEALDYLYASEWVNDNKIKLWMRDVNSFKLNQLISINKIKISYHFIDTGAPHVVLFINDLPFDVQTELKSIGIIKIGAVLRNHELFKPNGVNVNFVEIIDQSTISMRTYERGVEDETFACGTGSIACAIASFQLKNINLPIHVQAFSGEMLEIDFKESNGCFEDVTLTGPAKIVFEGEIQI